MPSFTLQSDANQLLEAKIQEFKNLVTDLGLPDWQRRHAFARAQEALMWAKQGVHDAR